MKMNKRQKLYPGCKEAEAEKRKAKAEMTEEPDMIGNAPNYDKFKGWTVEQVLTWLNID